MEPKDPKDHIEKGNDHKKGEEGEYDRFSNTTA